jgi:hypothetical protein
MIHTLVINVGSQLEKTIMFVQYFSNKQEFVTELPTSPTSGKLYEA